MLNKLLNVASWISAAGCYGVKGPNFLPAFTMRAVFFFFRFSRIVFFKALRSEDFLNICFISIVERFRA